jgi:hypothetical protein
MKKSAMTNGATVLDNVSNDAKTAIAAQETYTIEAEVEGVAALLFNRWSIEDVEAKGNAPKGSKIKKMDNLENMCYFNDKKEICIPGEYFRQSMIHAAKYRQDPRSPRKSCMDLAKASILIEPELCSLGVKVWDSIDRRRVVIQRSAITKSRPCMNAGWKAQFEVTILTPEYLDFKIVNEILQNAGKLVGVADFRPSHGRFCITKFKVKK